MGAGSFRAASWTIRLCCGQCRGGGSRPVNGRNRSRHPRAGRDRDVSDLLQALLEDWLSGRESAGRTQSRGA